MLSDKRRVKMPVLYDPAEFAIRELMQRQFDFRMEMMPSGKQLCESATYRRHVNAETNMAMFTDAAGATDFRESVQVGQCLPRINKNGLSA